MLVAHPLGERGMRAHQRLERLAQGRGVERDVARSARESAVGAVKQYPHMSTSTFKKAARQRKTKETQPKLEGLTF